jgi:hypothetical protein
LTASKKTTHPTSDAAAITAWKPRQTLITTVLANNPPVAATMS